MIDENIIMQRYAAMTNGELLQFASEDGSGLTKDAFLLLQKEFMKRNMDTHILDTILDGSFLKYKAAIQNIENVRYTEFNTTVLSYALNEKRDGKKDDEILTGLVDAGMAEEQALILIAQLEKHALHKLAGAKSEMLSAIFIFMAGIAIYMISKKRPVAGLEDILSICAVVAGTVLFLKSLFKKNKYVAVIRNINNI